MRKRVLLAFTLIFLLINSCGNSDKKEIEELLSRRQRAFETKNLELYLSCVAPDYNQKKGDEVIDIEHIKKNFLSNVSIFDQIRITQSDRTIYPNGDKAEVVQKIAVEVQIEKNQSRFQVKEKIGFEKIKGKWLIVKESDADFLEGFVFGGNM